jgi:hypothetical protein
MPQVDTSFLSAYSANPLSLFILLFVGGLMLLLIIVAWKYGGAVLDMLKEHRAGNAEIVRNQKNNTAQIAAFGAEVHQIKEKLVDVKNILADQAVVDNIHSEALRGQMRKNLIQIHTRCMADKSVSAEDWEQWNDQYPIYRKLNGNHLITAYDADIRRLRGNDGKTDA